MDLEAKEKMGGSNGNDERKWERAEEQAAACQGAEEEGEEETEGCAFFVADCDSWGNWDFVVGYLGEGF